jgi:nucleotide-binding universal stress UspA family protein
MLAGPAPFDQAVIMYQTIVVAYDGTEPGEAALQQGAALARMCQAQLHVLGVVVSAGGMLLDPAIVPFELVETERQVLQTAMTEIVQTLGRQVTPALTVIRDGEPAREIIAYVHEVKADLVVIGHSHQGLLARWFDTSVGTLVLDAMPCSVLVAIDADATPTR